MVSIHSIIMAAPQQVSCELAGESTILNLRNGGYYGLTGVGLRIWELLQQRRRVADIEQILLKEFEVEPERCRADLLSLLNQMQAESLIEVDDAPGS